jgi:glyceraldehyde-3-phosphate dehydrogenase/erythrose-4-phosphate dehydrogenase
VAAQGFPNSNVTNGAGNALKSCRQVDSPLGVATLRSIRAGTHTARIADLMSSAFRRFRAATAIPMAVSTSLATTVSGGVLTSPHRRAPGTGACTTTTAVWAATTPVRRTGSAPVASGILIYPVE